MRAELLTIGSELTRGATVNTNAAYLARQLVRLGITCHRQVVVPDEPSAVIQALRAALRDSSLVVTTGGLGPTFDDVTMAAIAEAAHRPLAYVPSVAAQIRRFYSRRHRRLQQAALRQALLPRGSIALPNHIGTASGVWLPLPAQLIIALPGVPRELSPMWDAQVAPRLSRLPGLPASTSITLRTVGLVELQIEHALRRLRLPDTLHVGVYPNLRAVDVQLNAAAPSSRRARALVKHAATRLRRALGASVYGTDRDTLEGSVGRLLSRQRKTLAIAESCTGGLVTDRLTNVPGSSRYLRGSVVAYHNTVKCQQLDVAASLVARHGAVSAPVARAMAQGARKRLGASIGLAITGIAGPTGGTKKKPVGLAYLALADARGATSLRAQCFGDRLSIKAQAAQTALDFLRRALL